MNTRSRIVLIIVLIIPLALLIWLGQRSLAQDRIVAKHQSTELAASRLREAQTLVHSFINEMEQSAVTALSFLQIQDSVDNDHITLMREAVNADPYLERVFVLDQERRLLFPLDSPIHSNSERRFAESFISVLRDENTFRTRSLDERLNPERGGNDEGGKKSSAFSRANRASKINKAVQQNDASQTIANDVQTGWTTWDTGTNTDIFLWHRNANQILIGQKLSSAYWLSQLIARLPAGSDGGVLSNASIRLVDKRERTIYQWGNYPLSEPSSGQSLLEPVSKEWLTYPLEGWRLEYYTSGPVYDDGKKWLFVFSFLCLLALLTLGWRMIWREYRREIHNAEQRVTFVNQVSHELKTPLTNICIYTDMLEAEVVQNDRPDQQRVKKFADVVTSESQRLGRLINNVLNFSRSQQQKIKVQKKATSVDAVIQQTLNNYTPSLTAKGIALDRRLAAPAPVLVDAEILEQVMNNLLSNIEKYVAAGEAAQVRSSVEDNCTTIWVCDTGHGIPITLRKKVFEPFERGDDSLTEGVSGTGIGLSIARDLCRLHGGDLVLVDDQGEFNGACFKATLLTEKAT